MIHVGALANLALQKFKGGTISIWQGGGKRLVLGGVRRRALAASLALRCPAPRGAAGNGTAEPPQAELSPTDRPPKNCHPAMDKWGAEAWEKHTTAANLDGLGPC